MSFASCVQRRRPHGRRCLAHARRDRLAAVGARRRDSPARRRRVQSCEVSRVRSVAALRARPHRPRGPRGRVRARGFGTILRAINSAVPGPAGALLERTFAQAQKVGLEHRFVPLSNRARGHDRHRDDLDGPASSEGSTAFTASRRMGPSSTNTVAPSGSRSWWAAP